jgi:hypothetical protein
MENKMPPSITKSWSASPLSARDFKQNNGGIHPFGKRNKTMKAFLSPKSLSGGQDSSLSLIWIGVLLSALFWLLEALVHSLVFHEGSYTANLLPHDSNEWWMRLLVSFLFIAFGVYANIIMARLKQSEREKAKLQKQLEDSLTKVLSGFIPICANCKKIRDDNGNWNPIEGYIQTAFVPNV